jgi:hypothetical protein
MTSSTNEELLGSVATLFDVLFDRDEDLLRLWSDCDMVDGLCDGIQQTMTSTLDGASTFVQSLFLLTTVEAGVASLVQRTERVTTVLLDFIATLSSCEGYLEKRWPPLHAAISLLTCLAQNSANTASSSSSSHDCSRAHELLECVSRDIKEVLGYVSHDSHMEPDDSDSLKLISKLINSLISHNVHSRTEPAIK